MTEIDLKKHALIKLIKEHAVLYGDFTLKSGAKSSHYIDLRRLTLHSEGLQAVAGCIETRLRHEGVQWDAVAGPSIGADPIIGALVYQSAGTLGFMVRSEAKAHGAGKRVEGQTDKIAGRKIVVVEDVITSGGSVLTAANEIVSIGGEVVAIVGVLDRNQGGYDAIVKAGFRYIPIVNLGEVIL